MKLLKILIDIIRTEVGLTVRVSNKSTGEVKEYYQSTTNYEEAMKIAIKLIRPWGKEADF